jgi:hypothetical protein
MYEQRMAQIRTLPPGPQKEAAMAAILRDYKGEGELAGADMEMGAEMVGTPSPGTVQGKSGDYTVQYAASPVEHLASALRQYKGGKMMKDARAQLKGLSEEKQRGLTDLFRAGLGGGTQYGMPGRTP